jgi:hypothetical protein
MEFYKENRHLLEVTRAILFQNNVPNIYWSDAVLTAIYLINRLPSPKLKNISNLEILKGRKIDLDHIRVLGCTNFVHIKRNNKFDKKIMKTIFLGYSTVKKGYKCYDMKNKKIYFSRDVSFFENQPYYQLDDQATSPSNMQNEHRLLFPNVFVFPQEKNQVHDGQMEEEHVDETSADRKEIETSLGGKIESESSEEATQEANLRRSTRQIHPLIRLRDYIP